MTGVFSLSRGPVTATHPWQTVFLTALIVFGSGMFTALIILDEARLAIAAGVAIPLLGLSLLNIRVAILAMVVYLIFLGDIRRMLIPIVGWSGLDPLLLLGGAFAILICAFVVARGAIRLDTPLSRWMVLLMAIMTLQVFNPKQGGLIVGIGGIMFLMIPLFWFWIGRTYGTTSFMNTVLFRIVVPLSIPASLFGLYHAFYGYLPYQLMWYDIAGYAALGSRENPAPVSLFASGTEFGIFLSITIVILWALFLIRKNYLLLLPIALLFVSVFLTGSRGPVAITLVACSILWAVLGRSLPTWITRGLLALVIAGAGMYWSLNQVSTLEYAPVQGKIDRQVQGLMNPTDAEKSSVGLHLWMMLEGYKHVVAHPLGFGLGSTTRAAQKFGSNAHSTETDLGNMLVSTGLIGGFVYHVVVFLIILSAIRYWRHSRSILALAIIGILTVTFFGWLRGGGYAVDPLVWMCIGSLDRLQNEHQLAEANDAAPRPEAS